MNGDLGSPRVIGKAQQPAVDGESRFYPIKGIEEIYLHIEIGIS
jgi:hypothetical protein